ncbi:MAG: NUDIX domain-containing protein [Deltaproteobacteria bacterium]|nr:NUDIX domain-containing protein [Deltaproteobacteria bacterium]
MKQGSDYIGVGVGAVIRDEHGLLFLARRGPAARNEQGTWEFPGGAVAFGETMAAALTREIHEEFGIRIAVGKLLDVIDHLLPEERQHWISPTFLCTILSGTPAILEPDKCSEIGWFPLRSLPENLSYVTRENVKNYLEHVKKI